MNSGAKDLDPQSVLVTGGAGYIGSHAVFHLKEAGYNVSVIDNCSRGHRETIEKLGVSFVEGNIDDPQALKKAFDAVRPAVLMHFAAYCYVGESVQQPAEYYRNNVASTLGMLSLLRDFGLRRVIFSSTCATYGEVERMPLDETPEQRPINPYGRSKLMVEQILKDFERAYGFRSIFFRYFNAAGALRGGLIGEHHDPETHLIPLAIYSAMGGPALTVFGRDYATPDGTCIRDYIHVSDIARAHILGLKYLNRENQSDAFNIGTGSGNSVAEVIATVERVSGRKVQHNFGPRRPGDPATLVAGADKLKRVLGWSPEYRTLEEIVQTAWVWHSKAVPS